LTSITIPNSVITIGELAFAYCQNLESITIGAGVTSLIRTLHNCPKLSNISIDNNNLSFMNDSEGRAILSKDGLTFLEYVANGITTAYSIPYGVTKIEDPAFYENSTLTSIIIPNSVTNIGDYAFGNCTKLESITIPNSVTSIGRACFGNCTNLSSVIIGMWLSEIIWGENIFYNCINLFSITVDPSNIYYSSLEGVLFNKDQTTLVAYPNLKDSSYVIPSSVTRINGEAFSYCTNLTSITIPDSVTEIGGSAFYGCENLTSIEIPNSVTRIDGSAFARCTGLTSVIIPNSVTYVGYGIFESCINLVNVEFSSSIQSIPDGMFAGCIKLTSIVIPSNFTYIGYNAFANSGLVSIVIPDNITYLGSGAFANCKNLNSVTIGSGVTNIGYYAFSGCISLDSVTLAGNVNYIGSIAFNSIKHLILKSSTLPTFDLTPFGSKLISIYVNSTLIDHYKVDDNWSAYSDYIYPILTIDELEYEIVNTNEIIITNISTTNTKYCIDSQYEITIGEVTSIYYVKQIGDGINCVDSYVTDIYLVNGIERIADYAFYNSSLTSIKMPSIIEIGDSAFYNSMDLVSIDFPESLTDIGEAAFKNCVNIKILIFQKAY
jgi:hypothetical protein